MYDRINDTIARADDITKNIQNGKGSAGMFLKDDALYKNLNSTLAHANSILAEADAGKGGVGLMLKDPKFRQDLSNTLAQINSLVSGINEGRGTLGKLVTDDSGLYESEQAADGEYGPGDDDSERSEEVSDDSFEDLLENGHSLADVGGFRTKVRARFSALAHARNFVIRCLVFVISQIFCCVDGSFHSEENRDVQVSC